MPTALPIAANTQSLGQEQPPNGSRGISDRAKQADFARPLLHAEPEEQCREQQRRQHEEKTEIREVLAEVGRAARRTEPIGADVHHGESCCQRIQGGAQA